MRFGEWVRFRAYLSFVSFFIIDSNCTLISVWGTLYFFFLLGIIYFWMCMSL